jgi:predicted metalloprotease with PDZ domain
MRKLVNRGVLSAALLAAGLAASVHPAAAQREGTTWLGVYTQQLTSDLREGMDYEGDGVLVNDVVNGSPADRAGLEKGDVLVRFDGRTVDSPTELSSMVRSMRVGESVDLVVWRDGDRRSLTARLGSRPGSSDVRRRSQDDEVDEDDDDDGMFDTPAPPAPRAPAAPRAPRVLMPGFDQDMFRVMGRGRLGVRVESLNSDLADLLDVPGGRGVMIIEVINDTPASRAGLKSGDVITRVDDRNVDEVGDLTEALRNAGEGTVSLEVIRKGARRTVRAELERQTSGNRISIDRDVDRQRLRDERARVRRETSNERDEELRRLREEVRELRRKLDELERD